MGAIAGTTNLLWLFRILVKSPAILIITRENIIILFIWEKLAISILFPDILERKEPIGFEKMKIKVSQYKQKLRESLEN